MSGQGEKKSIPRLQRCPGDGWPLRGLSRTDGSWASESPELGVRRRNQEGKDEVAETEVGVWKNKMYNIICAFLSVNTVK